jgi:hypothetical protein
MVQYNPTVSMIITCAAAAASPAPCLDLALPVASECKPHRTFVVSIGYELAVSTHCKLAFRRNVHNHLSGGFFVSHLRATAASFRVIPLSVGACRIRDTPNAGGNSVSSEVMSFEILRLLLNAKLSRTEMELHYFPRGKITDYSCHIGGQCMGVSVTRALRYQGVFEPADAYKLLSKKVPLHKYSIGAPC